MSSGSGVDACRDGEVVLIKTLLYTGVRVAELITHDPPGRRRPRRLPDWHHHGKAARTAWPPSVICGW
jgi:hypothetical protein